MDGSFVALPTGTRRLQTSRKDKQKIRVGDGGVAETDLVGTETRVTKKKTPSPMPEERFTVLVIRGIVDQDGWNTRYVEQRILDRLRNAPLQAIADINSSVSRGLDAPDEVAELRGALAMVRDHFPPMPLPEALLKNRNTNPAAVRAWCEKQLQAIEQELNEARRVLAEAAFEAPLDEEDNSDYCERAAEAVSRLSRMTPDLHDTLRAVSLEDLEEEELGA